MSQLHEGTPEYWAEHRPDAPAVVSGERILTYREWNDAADHVAEGLAARGLQAGDRLGMRFRLAPEWFIVQRALQKLGATQVAVNWRLTPDEAIYILHDSGAKGLACNDIDVSEWERHDVGLLVTVGQCADAVGVRFEDLLATEPVTPRFGLARPSLVLYTSGTTGRPRGVPPLDLAAITDHDRLFRYVAAVANVPPYPENPVTLLTLPIHHGAGPQIAAATCEKGGTVVLLDPYDAESALRLIERHKVKAWTAVPTMLLRVQKLPEDVLSRYDISSLKAVGVGAATVPHSLKEWIIEHLGDDVLWEAYGISEAGMVTFASPADQLNKPGTSGRPFEGVEIEIVDQDWNRLPAGEEGEIAVSTPVLLRNYLGGDALGEDVISDGFYRSGDVGYIDSDGYLFITDRIKDMIIAGGVNIYPAEIEKVIVTHPDVIDAAVIGVPDEDFGEKVLAFIVPKPGKKPTEEEFAEFFEGRLAKYKSPREIVFLDELPVNPTGKVLKVELRQPYWQGRQTKI